MTLRLSTVSIAATALLLGACATKEEPMAAPDMLVSAKVATPPAMDGNGNDAAWAMAKPITVKLEDGANFGGKGTSTATLKSVYSGDKVYFLVQYDDPTESMRRGPFQKQADGSWKKLKDPNDKGGDDNVYYEDKWAMIWNIDNSIAAFDKKGCMAACHEGESPKPYGNKYTSKPGEMGDIWHWKSQRTQPMGHVDDQWLDSTRFDPKTAPGAGRKSDPGGPEYKGFGLVNGKPEFMNKDGKAANAGGTFYIIDGNQVAFDDSKFKTGDEVASFLTLRVQGDRADIKVVSRWANGKWTSEVSRKLTTGSKFDVQFNNLAAKYGFGFAAFDNAQVRHAYHFDPLYLSFAK